MKSIREIYKIGKGPSSSHTMGPERAAKLFKEKYPEADGFRVVLFGSLSKTGVGHGTDRVVREVLSPTPTEIVFSTEELKNTHPNTMDLIALKDGQQTAFLRIESIGGGDIRYAGQPSEKSEEVYIEHSFAEIADFCKWRYIHTLSEYVELNEGPEIWDFLRDVWQTMKGRCENPNRPNYKNYGGRGIKVCKEWHEASNFILWALSNGYKRGLQLDRIDNDGNYCPENCKWSTNEEQCNNREHHILLTIGGETKTIAQWAKETGLKYRTIHARYNRGWTGESLIRKV